VHRLPREVLRKRPLPHVHKVSTRSNKVSPRTFQTALIFTYGYVGSPSHRRVAQFMFHNFIYSFRARNRLPFRKANFGAS
jgi:hypothetical protein